MRTDYESIQSFEVCGPDDSYNETEVTIGLECTAASFPGCFDPRWGGEPPSGPEFDVTSITVDVPVVNYKGEVTGHETPLSLTYNQFRALVGQEVCNKLVERAEIDAAENGSF